MPVLCGSVTSLVSFLFTNIRAIVGVGVPPLAFEVINAARKIKPDDGILRAVLLSFFFGIKEGRTALNLTGFIDSRIVLTLRIDQRWTSAKERKQQSQNG